MNAKTLEVIYKSCCFPDGFDNNLLVTVEFSEETFLQLLSTIDQILGIYNNNLYRFTAWSQEPSDIKRSLTDEQWEKIYTLINDYTKFSSSPEQENPDIQKIALTYPRHFRTQHICAITDSYIIAMVYGGFSEDPHLNYYVLVLSKRSAQ